MGQSRARCLAVLAGALHQSAWPWLQLARASVTLMDNIIKLYWKLILGAYHGQEST